MVPKIWKITKIYITRYRFLRVWYRNGTVNLRGFWGKMSPLQRGEEGRRTCVLRPSFGLWCQVKPARSEYQTIFVRSRKWSYRKAARTGNQGLYAAFPIPAIWNLTSDALLTGAPFALYGNENDHAEPHKVTRNRTHCSRFAEAWTGVIRLRGRKKLCCFGKDWICLRFSGLFPAKHPIFQQKGFPKRTPFCLFLLIYNPIQLHQLDALFCQLDGAGRAVVRAGLLSGVVGDALHPRHGQQVRALFEVRVAPLQIRPLGEHRAQDTAFLLIKIKLV